MRGRILLLACLLAAASFAPPARAQQACPGGSCVLAVFPAVGPIVLEGGEQGAFLLSMLSGLPAAELPLRPLSAPLDAEQQGLLGCGPYWGTVCERSGIDLRNADAGAVTQSWLAPGGRFVAGTLVQLPGASGPFLKNGVTPNPVYEVNPDGSIDGLLIPPRLGSSAGQQFVSELAALSYNLQLLLVAFSSGNAGRPGSDPSAFDPSNPYALYDPSDPATWSLAGQCSFYQPLNCSSIQAFFEVRPPGSQDFRASGRHSFGRRDFAWNGFGRQGFFGSGRGCVPARREPASWRSVGSRALPAAPSPRRLKTAPCRAQLR